MIFGDIEEFLFDEISSPSPILTECRGERKNRRLTVVSGLLFGSMAAMVPTALYLRPISFHPHAGEFFNRRG
jgi:hypothetical protein